MAVIDADQPFTPTTKPVLIDSAPTPPPSSETQDAFSVLQGILGNWGLPSSLAAWAWEMLLAGRSQSGVMLELRQRPEYKQRFAGNEQRIANGLPPITEAEYLDMERSYQTIGRNYGLPTGFYDSPDDFANWIGGDVSARELNERVERVMTVIRPGIQQAKDTFAAWYGVAPDDGAILAYALDPTRGLDSVNRQLTAAQLGSTASRFGLTADQSRAEYLATSGVDPRRATEAFSTIADTIEAQRFQAGAQDEALTQSELEDEALFGDASVTARRKRRAQQAAALFGSGGGAVAERGGVTGLGSVG